MPHKIYLPARRAIKEIWKYTNEQWGEEQANAYVHGLHSTVQKLADNRMIWRPVTHPGVQGVYFARYEHHYLFFRELSDGGLGVISVLHENMDLPIRLSEDLEEAEE
jgi:plasmid stabilization system protein ParE